MHIMFTRSTPDRSHVFTTAPNVKTLEKHLTRHVEGCAIWFRGSKGNKFVGTVVAGKIVRPA